ncbi:MAG: DUF3157 family protein [Bacteroidota bacterium]
MNKLLIYSFLLVATFSFAQNQTATTEDGKKVILKSDKTWEYINATISENDCNLGVDFIEIATDENLRKYVAAENNCRLKDVKFISAAFGKGYSTYSLCVNGKKMNYNKIGSVFKRIH